MNYLEMLFDYGAWYVEVGTKRGRFYAIHEYMAVALWRAVRKAWRDEG